MKHPQRCWSWNSPVALRRLQHFKFWACCWETRESFPAVNLAVLRFVRDTPTTKRLVRPDAIAAGNDACNPTQAVPTRTWNGMGAGHGCSLNLRVSSVDAEASERSGSTNSSCGITVLDWRTPLGTLQPATHLSTLHTATQPTTCATERTPHS